MAKKDISTNITKITPNIPDYMVADQGAGLDALKQYVIPPRIKIVQKQASQNLLDKFGVGDVILAPMGSTIVEMPRDPKGKVIEGTKVQFDIVPLFFYPEWIAWNPLETKGSEPAIRYRTNDPTDPIVVKARNPKLRFEPYPGDKTGKMFIRNVEHLNYIVVLHGHPLGTTPCVLSFSRGESFAGANFAGLLKMRASAIYGGRYTCVVNHRIRQLGDWYGIDVVNPEENPWVTEEEYAKFRELHNEFQTLYKESRLRVAHDEDDGVDGNSDVAASAESTEF